MSKLKKLDTIGKRLRHLRSLVRLTRKEMTQKYGIPIDTLVSWEVDRAKPTENSLKKYIAILSQEGVIVSKTWIVTSGGLEPRQKHDLSLILKGKVTKTSLSKMTDDELTALHVKLFLENTPNSAVMLVTSEEMQPFYAPDDYVGGVYKATSKEIAECIGSDCIVLTTAGDKFFRRLVRAADNKSYNLVCLNPKLNAVNEPVLYNVDIAKVAPIIWHRKPDTLWPGKNHK